jgi:hypothetical protein
MEELDRRGAAGLGCARDDRARFGVRSRFLQFFAFRFGQWRGDPEDLPGPFPFDLLQDRFGKGPELRRAR